MLKQLKISIAYHTYHIIIKNVFNDDRIAYLHFNVHLVMKLFLHFGKFQLRPNT